MTDSPDAIRADIERTRQELGSDVDALADKVTPSKIIQRQTGRVRNAFGSLRDRVMGTADDTASSASGLASDAAGAARDVVRKAEGNPIAVGLVAFGVGLLAASLIPASQREQQAAETVKEKAQPLVDEATGVARQVAEDLKEPAQEAATAIKDRAQTAVDNVKQESADAAGSVRDRADEARSTISDS